METNEKYLSPDDKIPRKYLPTAWHYKYLQSAWHYNDILVACEVDKISLANICKNCVYKIDGTYYLVKSIYPEKDYGCYGFVHGKICAMNVAGDYEIKIILRGRIYNGLYIGHFLDTSIQAYGNQHDQCPLVSMDDFEKMADEYLKERQEKPIPSSPEKEKEMLFNAVEIFLASKDLAYSQKDMQQSVKTLLDYKQWLLTAHASGNAEAGEELSWLCVNSTYISKEIIYELLDMHENALGNFNLDIAAGIPEQATKQ